MKFRTLIRRSLRFHWRSHLGVVLGAAIGSAALIGALVVGDSVKHTLQYQAVQRLPGTSVALDSGDRFFASDLLQRMIKIGAEQSQQVSSQEKPLTWGNGFTPYESATGLHLEASVARSDGTARAQRINLYGVGTDILEHIRSGERPHDATSFPRKGVWLNKALADQIGAKVDDELIFRIPKPAAVSQEITISRRDDATSVLRLRVIGVSPSPSSLSARWRQEFLNSVFVGAPPTELSLRPTTRPAMNAFVDLTELYEAATAFDGKANFILTSPASQMRQPNLLERYRSVSVTAHNQNSLRPILRFGWIQPATSPWGFYVGPRATFETVTPIFHAAFRLTDAQASLERASKRKPYELKSSRIFLDPPLIRSALCADTNAQPILTYLATLLRAGTNLTPYSMVTAAGTPWTPVDLRDDEIVVSQWLAEDLRVKPGDEIALSYFLPESGAKLEEATNIFRVHSIVPMEMPWSDRTLMPDFPGIEKAESTSEWDAGFPLTYKVRPKDDDYWKQHRGTPKAFITLAAGQKMWGNRFGNLTAIRFPIPTNSQATNYQAELEKKILTNLKPEELGLRFEPVREQAIKAAEESQDFGGLFLGFSFFVIAAALLLMAMLFQFGLEQRAPEIGTLLALGFTPKQVRNLFLREGVTLAFIGGVIGAVGGIFYAKVMIHGLSTVWRDAVGATALSFHFTAQTLAIGVFASVVVSTITIWLALRKFVNRPAMQLLTGADLECGDLSPLSAGDLSPSSVEGQSSWWRRALLVVRRTAGRGAAWATSRPSGQSGDKSPHSKAWLALAGSVGLVGWTLARGDTANAGAFFGGGALVLLAGLSVISAWLAKLSGAHTSAICSPEPTPNPSSEGLGVGWLKVKGSAITLGSLALRGCARRRKRSLATIAMLACGSFLIVSIGVFRLDANRDATQKTSGTGGFALMGETTMPVVHDLNSQSGREFFALDEKELAGVNVVPFRVRAGDEASCLNLNAAQKPRLIGVKAEILRGRFGFAKGEGWQILQSAMSQRLVTSSPTNEIPAIGDANSIQWAMHKKIGDTIDYMDERGQPFKVRIVGAVANSILQGQLIIDEVEFVKRFPGESGYRMFLMDAPSNTAAQVSAALSRAMQDVGLELTPTVMRLNQFNAVQNTYLGTFQILGGLGLLLGSVGLGIVVLRNVLERRGELAVMMAVGFRKATLQQLLLMENGALLLAGLALGIIAAAVAVLPALLSANGELPVLSLAITLGAVLVNGAAWTWAATRFAVRGDLLKALRNE